MIILFRTIFFPQRVRWGLFNKNSETGQFKICGCRKPVSVVCSHVDEDFGTARIYMLETTKFLSRNEKYHFRSEIIMSL